jgi:hypothetical protein
MKGYLTMKKTFLNLADNFEKLAKEYRDLAECDVKEVAEVKEEPEISIEIVRALLAEKSRDGKTKDIKALLMKYDAGKLSGVKPEDYRSLMADAEKL